MHPLILSNFLKLELFQQFHLFLNETCFLKVAKVPRIPLLYSGKTTGLAFAPPRQDHFCIGVVQKVIDVDMKRAGHRGCWLCV